MVGVCEFWTTRLGLVINVARSVALLTELLSAHHITMVKVVVTSITEGCVLVIVAGNFHVVVNSMLTTSIEVIVDTLLRKVSLIVQL